MRSRPCPYRFVCATIRSRAFPCLITCATIRSRLFRCFHSTNWTHCKRKMALNPPKRPTCRKQFSECPSQTVPIAFGVATAPLGVHIMPSLKPNLPGGRAQHIKCHQSTVQGFSLTLTNWRQRKQKKGNKVPKASNLSLTVLRVAVPSGPNSFCTGCAPPGVHIIPSLRRDLPVGRAQHVKCHQSAVQGFSLYQLDTV